MDSRASGELRSSKLRTILRKTKWRGHRIQALGRYGLSNEHGYSARCFSQQNVDCVKANVGKDREQTVHITRT